MLEYDLPQSLIDAVWQKQYYFNGKGLAEFLVVSPNTIRKEIYQGKLRASKRSGTWIIERRDLLQYLENHSNLNME